MKKLIVNLIAYAVLAALVVVPLHAVIFRIHYTEYWPRSSSCRF